MQVCRLTGDEQGDADAVASAAEALRGGRLVVVPTDTVYGIAADATNEAACAGLAEAKLRDPARPVAVIFASVGEALRELGPLPFRATVALGLLLPGPFTLVLPNPKQRFPWLCGSTPKQVGVRVPVGALRLPPMAATSANLSGQPEAPTPSELPPGIASLVDVALDAGVLEAGSASTVLDLVPAMTSGDVADIIVLRDPADRAPEALERLDHSWRSASR